MVMLVTSVVGNSWGTCDISLCAKNTYDDKCQSSIIFLHCCATVMLKFIWEFGKGDICIHILFVVIENCL
jgi:hypothetical protein